MHRMNPMAASRLPAPSQAPGGQREFAQAIFGDQLTTGKQPSGRRRVPLSWCLLRLLDQEKENCLWQDAYRRLDSVQARMAWLTERSTVGHAFFIPNGFRGNGRQEPWRPAAGDSGKRPRSPRFRFGEAELASLLTVVLELDHGRVSEEIRRLHDESPETFWLALHQELQRLGVGAYLVVRTRPGFGYHVYLLLDPCSAAENLPLWKAVSKGLQRLFATWGADPGAAGNAVQPYRLPGSSRPDIPGYQTEWVLHQPGARVPLAKLAATLEALGALPEVAATTAAPAPCEIRRLTPEDLGRGPSLLSLIESGQVQRGFVEAQPSRNRSLFDLWRCLHTEGWPEERIDAAVARVNQLCQPGPVGAGELAKIVRSARQYDQPAKADVWDAVCRALGVDLAHPGSRASRGKALREAPDRYQRQIALAGEALDRFLSLNPVWQGQMAALLEAMGMPQAALRALRAAISEREKAGRLTREIHRGRHGYIRLAVVEESSSSHEKTGIVFTLGGAGGLCLAQEIPSRLQENPASRVCAQEAGSPAAAIGGPAGVDRRPPRTWGAWQIVRRPGENAEMIRSQGVKIGRRGRRGRLLVGLRALLARLGRVEEAAARAEARLVRLGRVPGQQVLVRDEVVVELEVARSRLLEAAARCREELARQVQAAREAGALPAWMQPGMILARPVVAGGWQVSLAVVQPVGGRFVVVEVQPAGDAVEAIRLRVRPGASVEELRRVLGRSLPAERRQGDLERLAWLVLQVLPGVADVAAAAEAD